jgi:hypothetical protein
MNEYRDWHDGNIQLNGKMIAFSILMEIPDRGLSYRTMNKYITTGEFSRI